MSGHWIKLNDTRIRTDWQSGQPQEPYEIADTLSRLYDVPNAPIVDFDPYTGEPLYDEYMEEVL